MSSNESVTVRQHAYTGPAAPQLPEPSHAERVRTLLSRTTVATLSTLSRKHVGFPFGSLMPYALDHQGRPLFLISNMAMHTQNLRSDPRASLFVAQTLTDGDPLGAARATLIGQAEPLPENEVASAREFYLTTHENSRSWVDFADFGFFRLEPVDIYYVGVVSPLSRIGKKISELRAGRFRCGPMRVVCAHRRSAGACHAPCYKVAVDLLNFLWEYSIPLSTGALDVPRGSCRTSRAGS
jgi:hypothetical protein